MSYTLLSHQSKLIVETREALIAGHKRVLNVLPTGGGKTLTFCMGYAQPAYQRGKRVWVVVPKTALVDQTSAKLDEIGVPHGVIQAKHWRTDKSKLIQVISKDTIVKRLGIRRNEEGQYGVTTDGGFQAPDLIIHDEAHHLTDDNTFGAVMDAFPAAIQIGATATPVRLDGRGLGRCFSAMVVGPSVNDLIRLRILIPSRVFGVPVDLNGVGLVGADYNQRQLGQRMGSAAIVGDMVLEYHHHARGRRAVGFATTKDNAKQYAETFAAAGIPSGYITEETSPADRKKLVGQLKAGYILVLWSVGVFTEGFDLPCVECVIFARPTKSLQLFIQMAGRGIRAAEGPGNARDGEHCVMLDHANLFGPRGHGYIEDDRQWTLDDRPKKALPSADPPSWDCPHCKAELRSWPVVCPSCGESLRDDDRDKQQRLHIDDVRLVEHDRAEAAMARLRERQEFYRIQEEIAYLNNLPAYTPGVKFKARFGEYPKAADKAESNNRIKLIRGIKDGEWKAVWTDQPANSRMD